MNDPHADISYDRLLKLLGESVQRNHSLHRHFLEMRRDSLQNVCALIDLQMRGIRLENPAQNGAQTPPRPALFDARQLDEFGSGKISACLGPQFARYDGRRIPRIPNGDLRMMSRVVNIAGRPGDFNSPASVVTEYDVPWDAWYLHDSAFPDIPCSLWMEIALQPCGFLSAYLDTYALVPYEEFHFRNLDGSLRLLEPSGDRPMDVRGKTLTTRARLLSNVVSSGTVIQKYAFEIACEGLPIYDGESIFGYFSMETMTNQVGLDNGRAVPPALRTDPGLSQASTRIDLRHFRTESVGRPYYRLAQDRLHFLEEITVSPNGGNYGKGYVYASRPVDPHDWYYPYHFYQDPVMPGSLGVEAILEAIQGFALTYDIGRAADTGMRSPRFGRLPGSAPMTWRYRGQITQQHHLMELEVHLSAIEQRLHARGMDIALVGDASLWINGLRIYEVKNATVGVLEG